MKQAHASPPHRHLGSPPPRRVSVCLSLQLPVSVPKGAPHVKRPRRTSNFGLFASTATRHIAKPDRNAIERNRFAAAKLRKKKAAIDAHDPLALARADEARKYKTVIVLGGARTDGGGFCSPEAVFRLLCAPPPFVADDESVVRRVYRFRASLLTPPALADRAYGSGWR